MAREVIIEAIREGILRGFANVLPGLQDTLRVMDETNLDSLSAGEREKFLKSRERLKKQIERTAKIVDSVNP